MLAIEETGEVAMTDGRLSLPMPTTMHQTPDTALPLSSWGKDRAGWLIVALIALLVLAYANTFSVPFIFDDQPSIEENKTITNPDSIWETLAPPRNTTLEGRPVANATLAVNFAISGMGVWSYHLTNLSIHIGAALLMFGVVRRTLLRDTRWSRDADLVAWVIAGVWALHPLQTESVTYIVQRVESLMGFFYMLTLYAFIRSCEAGAGRAWGWLAVVACWLGMGTKEVMVSAPLLVLLYDRTQVSETFLEALKQRWCLYLGMFASWGLLAWLLASSFDRANTAGFNAGVSSWHYLLTQCGAIVTYLRLSVWPDELTFDYGRFLVKSPADVWMQGVLLMTLLAGSLLAVMRRSWLGIAGIWFFATLAPSSSVVPVVTQTMTEHRMYLALAGVVVAVVVLVWNYTGKRGVLILATLVPVLAVTSYRRNELYREPLRLWMDTVQKLPTSARAQSAVGYILSMDGKPEEGLAYFERAITQGDYVDAEVFANYAYTLNASGRLEEAEAALKEALRRDPRHHKVLAQQGNIAMKRGQMREAAAFFEQSLTFAPGYQTARTNLAAAYLNLGEVEKAAKAYAEALKRDENCCRAWVGLGVIAYRAGRLREAEALCRRSLVVASKADEAEARSRLGEILAAQQRAGEAESEMARVLELNPRKADTRQNFASLLAQRGRYAEAVTHYERVEKETGLSAGLLGSMAMALELDGQHERAKACYEDVLRLDPMHSFARERLNGLRQSEP